MSKKQKTVVVSDFPQTRPIPVLEPSVKTGNGKATFKTATAAANAARDARDEARVILEQAKNVSCQIAGQLITSKTQVNECELYYEAMIDSNKSMLKWDKFLLALLILDIAAKISVLLMT